MSRWHLKTVTAGRVARRWVPALGLAVALQLCLAAAFGPAQALTPLPPCIGTESGMMTQGVTDLGPAGQTTGVTVESYAVRFSPGADGVYRDGPAPVPALKGFNGIRVLHCASGQFFAVETNMAPETVAAVLSATEFLRGDVQGGRRVSVGDLAQAIRAVYGKHIRLRETEETCGCNWFYPELRPASMAPFRARTDVNN